MLKWETRLDGIQIPTLSRNFRIDNGNAEVQLLSKRMQAKVSLSFPKTMPLAPLS